MACKTGRGLPFGAAHKKAKEKGESSNYSYSKFKSKLRRIREIFPVDYVEKLDQFETCHLEWLAVFLSVPDWRPRPSSSETTEKEEEGIEKESFDSTRIAVNNLRSQLGIPKTNSASAPFFLNSLMFSTFQEISSP